MQTMNTHTRMPPPIFRQASICEQLEPGQLEKFLNCKQVEASLPTTPSPPLWFCFQGETGRQSTSVCTIGS